MATIEDVARLAGVSATTAKRAIRAPGKLAPETLERVLAAIEELRYEPDQIASALRRGQSTTIGLVIGNIVEPFFATLTRTLCAEIHERGFTTVMADSEYRTERELEHLRHFAGNRVAGLVLRSGYGEPNLDYLRRLQRRGTAVVEIDYHYPGSPFSHVMLDNAAAVREGVAHLASLGHRRIAAIGAYHPEVNPENRSRVFPEVLREHGLELPDAYRRVIHFTEGEAYRATRGLLALPEPPTALFALTGALGQGAFRAIRDLGLELPRDVSLLTFDDYAWTSLVQPGIDVLAQPVERMGRAAVEILFAEIGRDPPPAPTRLRFPATLRVRGSCGPPGRD